jgi:hypothetical protein
MKNIKLSTIQVQVITCLEEHDSFIQKSKYYNHNKVISRKLLKDYTTGFEYNCLMQFSRPTFDVLLRLGIIKQTQVSDIYILA